MLSRFAVCLLVAAVLCSRNPTLRANSSNSLMDVSPDGTRPLAAVAVYHENKVVVFNADDGRTVATVAVPAEPYGIVSNRSGSRLWVTHEYPGLVSEIELNGN